MKLYPEAVTKFLDSGICRTVPSRNSYRQTLRSLQDRFPGTRLEEFTADQLADFCRMNTPAPNTVRRRRAMLMGFFDWAAWKGLVPTSPAAGLKYEVRITGGGVTAHNWLTEPEVAAVLRACPDDLTGRRDRILLMFGFFLGLRVSDLAGLEWSQLSPDMGRVTFFGKGNKLAQLGVPPQLRAELHAWRREAPLGAKAVLPHLAPGFGPVQPDWGRRLLASRITRLVKEAGDRVGVTNLCPHDLRRTFAGLLEAQGMPIADISRLLRHSNIGTTSTYLEKNPHRTAALADTFTIAL
jgi:integrase/recombinase XerD